ncbi:PucR family transcriptional regulator ligand-binding domain-containing protein [Humibacter sp.]|jgi:purine catabolism regulator|uniref:PucR family transcriptional regulator ligand-binding domain-containing protein n=1 Tax=Humibacter sp. TaxID=1940291 RepID=UPI002C62B39A|nr:PucR family transcriptional regulator ligand-binding domain-containing protein [Humibacter sp.]HVX07350.1 PucR family transcriptional regulator ligand-binding domain-containing protein [Humibacter sp.]
MPAPTVTTLLGRRELALHLLTPQAELPSQALDAAISWVHSSDLDDPTPFLIPGQVLLTTGTQFGTPQAPAEGSRTSGSRTPASSAPTGSAPAGSTPTSGAPASSAADYDGYVNRLALARVAALGFGTDVVRQTPAELADACVRHGIPLFEVPYRTPFIAVARYAADLLAEQAYARNTWALSAQRAVSFAALRADGLHATLDELSRQLGKWVALVDADGAVDRVFPTRGLTASARANVETEARRLLAVGRRAASAIADGDTVMSLQTIGASDRLLGVLAHGGADDLDQAAQQVVTSVVALAGLALGQGRALESARATMRAVLLRALEDARTLADDFGGELGEHTGLTNADVAALDRASSHLEAAVHRASVGAVAGPQPPADAAGGQPLGEHRVRGRATDPRAAGGDPAGARSSLLAALDGEDGRSRASALLAPLRAQDSEGVLSASVLVWLEHNGVYDAAARELGVHRHTLTARIRAVEKALGRNFGSFAERAEVWAALRTVRAGHDGRDG